METKEIKKTLQKQLNNFWDNHFDIFSSKYDLCFNLALEKTKTALSSSKNKYYFFQGFCIYNSTHYTIFLYFLSNLIGKDLDSPSINNEVADKLYYLNKIMHGIDLYWGIDLPEHILFEHPVGSVLGRASYGDYLLVYQGCTIGGSYRDGEIKYPSLGDNIIMYANSSIIGDCNIGNNVIVSANVCIVNTDVPDNVIVFGEKNNLVFKTLSNKKISNYFGNIWEQETI